MKFKFLLLAALAALSISCAGPRTYKAPSVAATRAGITKSQESVASAQSHVVAAQKHAAAAQVSVAKLAEDKTLTPELHDLAINAKAEIDFLTKELVDTQEALAIAQKNLADSQTKVGSLETEINAQTETLNATAADLAKTKQSYHRIKFDVCVLAAVVVFLLLWHFKTVLVFIPPPYNLAVLVVGPAAVFGLLWLLL